MKPWYKNTAVVIGIVLAVLGAGNWATGTVRMREHERFIATTEARRTAPDAAESDDDAQELELARVRMDFYHVVASGGRLLTTAGLMLTTVGLARYLRPRARRRFQAGRTKAGRGSPNPPQAGGFEGSGGAVG